MTTASTDAAQPRRTAGLLRLNKLVNPLVLNLAGTRLLPLYGVLTHRGRRSGRVFRTPVVVRPTSDGFIVPMPWGPRTDWYRNLNAAAGGMIRWNGRDYPVGPPQLIDASTATDAFNSVTRAIMATLRIRQAARLRQVT